MDIVPPDPPDKIMANVDREENSNNNKSALTKTVPSQVAQANDSPPCTSTQVPVALPPQITDMNFKMDIISGMDQIALTTMDKERIYRPWEYSVIIKLASKKVNDDYLKKLLIRLWKPTEDLVLIDLRFDYYTVKFLKEDNMHTALRKGPWFINGLFLSVKRWHPNFL
ncbi:hypothetical protein FXO38_04871 [Capsicum annuum]|nr:hypothetical protein FXO38_04871 [Capsicum annuum]